MNLLNKRLCVQTVRCLSTIQAEPTVRHCKLLVVGGGTGGCSVAWRFSKKLSENDIILLEPSKVHYYQPLFTLVAAGINKVEDSKKPLNLILPPKNVNWIEDSATEFDPENCCVTTSSHGKICYEYLVVAVGLKNDYHLIEGLKPGLDCPHSCVSTIYSPEYCTKSWCCIHNFQGGNAVFSFPTQGAKCSGAAQKIMYLADDYWRKKNVRHQTSIQYNTAGDSLFGVPKYAKALTNVAWSKGICVNCHAKLVEVTPRTAIFDIGNGQRMSIPYNFLHVTPPMSPPECLKDCPQLVDRQGYLDVDKFTLQHVKYYNVYGLGDCTNTPNSKTAAAIGCQSSVLEENLYNTMQGLEPTAKYDGYGACPMLTSYKKGILAEFIYGKEPRETFPWDQSKERRLFYHMKTKVFPYIYWNKLIKGEFDGPTKFRKIINPLSR